MAVPNGKSVAGIEQGLLFSPSDGALEDAKSKYLPTETPFNHAHSRLQQSTIIHKGGRGPGFDESHPSSDETADHNMICSWADQLALFLRENDQIEQTSTEIEGCLDAAPAKKTRQSEPPIPSRSRRMKMIENEWNNHQMMEKFRGPVVASKELDLQNEFDSI